MKHINIYTQSTIRSPRTQKGKIIYLLESEYKGEPLTKHSIEDVEDNWNGASLEAVKRALSRVNGPAEIEIWTDNPYIKANIDRASKWQQCGFEKSPGEKRKHWEQWEEILGYLKGCSYIVNSVSSEYSHWMISELKRAMKGDQEDGTI